MIKDSRQLPVYRHRERIIQNLREHQVIVVESPTGSGKTTQLPIILHEAGYDSRGIIGITQPRRIATIGVTTYIQQQLASETTSERGSPTEAAYKIRFIDNTGPQTSIKVMTDGVLLQELKLDPMLERYSVLMIDEAHERSLNIDFILGLLKYSLEQRSDLRIVISSATINAEVFSEYFECAPVVRIETQPFPINVVYAPPVIPRNYESLIEKVVGVLEHTLRENTGDILIFLSGEKSIKDCIRAIRSRSFQRQLHIIPLYGRLSKEEQDEVFITVPEGKTKVVVATNIAETSITIDGVSTVIDSGLSKMNCYNPRTYTSSLIEQHISQASANQRRGRAGRTGPGNCYRLYRREDFERSPLFTEEEIYHTDLSEVILRMAELGIRDFESFDFISAPKQEGIASAIETLVLLEALNIDRSLSEIGTYMSVFPLLPRHSRTIVEAVLKYPEVLNEVIIAISFLSTNSPLLLPQGKETEARNAHHHFRDESGDFVSYLKIFKSFKENTKKETFCKHYYLDMQVMHEIVNIQQQLSKIVEQSLLPAIAQSTTIGDHFKQDGILSDGLVSRQPSLTLKDTELRSFICAIAKGLIQFICIRTDKHSYRSLTAERIEIHPSSVMFREAPRFLVAGEVVKTSRVFARSVSALNKEWLSLISPDIAILLTNHKVEKSIRGHKRRRKTTNPSTGEVFTENSQIILGGKVHELRPFKGKKRILLLTWQELLRLSQLKHFERISQYQSIRICVHYRNLEFMRFERLGRALKIVGEINPERDILPWPRHNRFDFWASPETMITALKYVLKLSIAEKGKTLGFITLYNDEGGGFWLRTISNFNNSLLENLASLESLTDNIISMEGSVENAIPVLSSLKKENNRLYRYLSKLLENI